MWQSLNNIYKSGVFSERILENLVSGNRLAVIKIVLPVDPNFEKNDATALEEVIIQDMLIPNPFLAHSC